MVPPAAGMVMILLQLRSTLDWLSLLLGYTHGCFRAFLEGSTAADAVPRECTHDADLQISLYSCFTAVIMQCGTYLLFFCGRRRCFGMVLLTWPFMASMVLPRAHGGTTWTGRKANQWGSSS